jgi:NitT/TauT family transport system substrate-binding protein
MGQVIRMRRPATTLLLTVMLVLAAGCGSDDGGGGAAGPDQVKVGVIPIIDVAPIYLGKQQGFFSKRNIELQFETAQGGAAIVPGVVSGQFQFGFSNMTSMMIARDRGIDIQVLAPGSSSTGEQGKDFGAVVVKADSPVKSAKDLAGKTVAVNTLKNIGDSTVKSSIRKDGGDAAAVKFVEMPLPDMPAAVANGRVDAAWVVEPFLTITTGQGDRPIAWNFVDTAPDLMVAGYFTSGKLVREKADLAKRFTEAINESQAYAAGHPDEARSIITTYTQIDKATADKLTLPAWPAQVNRESTQVLADIAVQDKLVSKAPDLDALLP